ncbi:LPS export ABC transporter permease LptF [Pseudomonas capeferrum]|uniref:LPS export ABC transporter permease LptF n=1 Tax=Pseudomonas capeferrum TaxID=1495066 RepID=UPI0015E294F5|nr:LPS export ABC transporter permease LptF [Pseudomonas capeferrum]MBA1200202.1 LPS export ABC transporter permease LptF [Pseudomonas capeferrum]
MLTIERYIIAEVRRPVTMMVGFLTFVFASYSAERYLTEAANGTLALSVVVDIVFYKVLIALEMLLPVGLYAAVAIALGRLYNDSEITALLASGVSPLRIYRAVLIIATPLALAVTVLSFYGRPWAYAQAYRLEQLSRSDLDVSHLQAQRFNLNDDNGRMILAQRIDQGANRLTDALIFDPGEGKSRIFRAKVATVTDPDPAAPALTLQQGSTYTLDHHGSKDTVLTYKQLMLRLKPIEQTAESRRKSTPSAALAVSALPQNKAELQWRESRGLIAVLLGLLAVPLSRTAPRKGRFSTLLPIAVLFTVVFYGGNLCRTLVANGVLPVTPGLWLVPMLMLVGLGGLIARDLRLLPKRSR